ncbi:hypothetical protein OAA69_01400, partial [bacterium]|nr:hypothetical protein [bacterium]
DPQIIAEFVALVHPDLQEFFDDYVTGRNELPTKEYLNKVGIDYDRRYAGPVVVDPLRDNGYKTRGIRSTDYIEIKNISKENPYELEKGDRVQRYADELETAYGGPKEGSPLVLLIERNGTKFTVPYNVAYTTGSKKNTTSDSKEIRLRHNQPCKSFGLRISEL